MKPLPLDPLCHLVWTACFEAALYIAQAETSAEGRQEMSVTLMGLIGGLRRKQEDGGSRTDAHVPTAFVPAVDDRSLDLSRLPL